MSSEIQTQLSDTVKLSDKEIGASVPLKQNLFCLWYRENSNPHPLTKYFFHPGDLPSAIARGRVHCERVGQRFIWVRPFLTDLDKEEKRIQGDSN
jgi:hypothetical protein